jgi:hypothetical protein
MTRDDIIRIAREVGLTDPDLGECVTDYGDATDCVLRLFDAAYAAGAAAERNRFESSSHSCSPHCDRPACVATRRAVEEERERLRAQYGIVTDNGAALPDAMTQRHKPPEPLA